MSTTPDDPGAATAAGSVVERLLASLEADLVAGLEADYAHPSVWIPTVPVVVAPFTHIATPAPSPGPDAAARARAVKRAERAAAARAELEDRLDPASGSDSSQLWAIALGVVDPADIAPRPAAPELLADLARVDREADQALGRRHAAIAAIAGIRPAGAAVSSDSDRHIAHEIAITLGISKDSAQHQIATARALFSEFAPFGHALIDGTVSDWHARTLISECVNVTDPDTRTAIGELALPFAQSMVVAQFRVAVAALIAELDPDAVNRNRKARDGRSVYVRRGKDGMSFLGLTHETPVVDAIMATLTQDAQAIADQRTRDNDSAAANDGSVAERVWSDADLRADACRADALMARVLGTVTADGAVTFDRAAATGITTEIVIDLDTLHGLQDRVALINGQPVPADIARDHAAWTTLIRRIVTDPVTGALLDYGHKIYIPPAVRRFCFARDGGCRSPGCTRHATRYLQLDHAEEAPHGPSSAGNCGALCTECHQRKTAGLLDITDTAADGTATFHTAWGQTVHIPARPYLPRLPGRASTTIEPPPF